MSHGPDGWSTCWGSTSAGWLSLPSGRRRSGLRVAQASDDLHCGSEVYDAAYLVPLEGRATATARTSTTLGSVRLQYLERTLRPAVPRPIGSESTVVGRSSRDLGRPVFEWRGARAAVAVLVTMTVAATLVALPATSGDPFGWLGRWWDRSARYDLGRVIGLDQAGNPVTGIQVWVRGGYIRTAYPVAP